MFVTLAIGLALLLFPVSLTLYMLNEPILEILLYHYSGVMFTLSISASIGFVFSVYVRMKSFVEALEGKSINENYEIQLALNGIYHDLIDIVNDINIAYGFQIMLSIGFIFFFNVFIDFILYKLLFYKQYQYMGKSIGFGLYGLHGIFFGDLLVALCYLTISKARRAVRLINGIIKRSKDHRTITMMLSLATLIHENPPIFSSGLIDFDFRLTFAALAALNTQIIILMQFDMAGNRLKN